MRSSTGRPPFSAGLIARAAPRESTSTTYGTVFCLTLTEIRPPARIRLRASSVPATICHQRRSRTSSRYRSFHSRRASTYGFESLMSTPFCYLEWARSQFAYQLSVVGAHRLGTPEKVGRCRTIGVVGEGQRARVCAGEKHSGALRIAAVYEVSPPVVPVK